VGPDHVTVGAVEFGVDIQQRLDVVIAGGNVFEAIGREAGSGLVDGGRGARLLGCDVDREDGGTVKELVAWLGVVSFCEEDEHSAGDGCRVEARRKRDFETHRMGALGEGGEGDGKAQRGRKNCVKREKATNVRRRVGRKWHATRVSACVGVVQLEIAMARS
jgi:hypothetical protein